MKFRRQTFLRTLTRQFWGFVVCTIIALAVVVQIGRLAFPLIDDYRYVIEDALSDQLGVEIEIGSLTAEWQGLRPKILLNQLEVKAQGSGQKIFSVERALAELSLVDSLIQGGLAWRTITFEEFDTTLEQAENFSWSLKGYDGGTVNSENPFLFDDPLDIFLFGRRVEIRSALLHFEFITGKHTELTIPLISLENDRFFHRMQAEIGASDNKFLEFIVEGYGDPRDRESFSASGYLALNSIPLEDLFGAILKELPDNRVFDGEEDAELDLKFWFRGNPSLGVLARGAIEVSDFPRLAQQDLTLPTRLASNLGGAWKEGQGGYLSFQGLEVDWGEKILPIDGFTLFTEDKNWGLRLPELDVVQLISIFNDANADVDEGIGEFIKGLDPSGTIKNLDLRLTSKDSGWFKARAYLENAGIKAYKGIPEVQNADAYVEANLHGGFVDLDTEQNLVLHIPKSFNQAFVLDQAKGQLRWSLDYDEQILRVNTRTLSGQMDGADVSGAFALVQGLKRGVTEPYLSILLQSDQVPADNFWRYMPSSSPKPLIDWLDESELDASLENVVILYDGSVAKESKFKPTYQVSADFSSASLKFDTAWPKIEDMRGSIFLNSDKFRTSVLSGTLANNIVRSVDISTETSADELSINIRAEAFGKTEDARALVLNSSLQEEFSSFLSDWRFSGDYDAQLELKIPIDGANAEITHNVDVQFQDNSLWVGQLEVELQAFSGKFNSSTDNLFNSGEMTAELWGRPLTLSAGSANDVQDIHIQFSGDVNMAGLKQWAQRPELVFFQNDSRMSGSATIPTSDQSQHEAILVSIHSSLSGTEIDLPAPFKKTADHFGDFKLDINIYDELIRYVYNHDNLLKAEIISKDEGLPAIALNFDKHRFEQMPPMEYGKVNAYGKLRKADYDAWILAIDQYVAESDAIEALIEPEGAQESEDIVTHLDLKLDAFTVGELLFDDIEFSIDSEEEQWKVAAKSDTFIGDIYIPIEDKPTRLDIQYLSILEEDADLPVDESAEELSALSDIDLSEVGPMHVDIAQLKIEKSDWGVWSFDVAPIENGLHFFNLKADVKGLKIGHTRTSDFFWTNVGDQHKSRFVGPIDVDDTLTALRAWELEEIVTSEKGHFDTDIHWYAEPDMIALENLIGSVAFSLESGSFLQAEEAGENPLLRLMALLNFDTFARRLRFDFSDLGAKGFHYDSVASEIQFNEGTADIIQPLVVNSSSSKMNMTGTLDLVNEKVDGELAVTLPVGGNLAFATAFAAGLPAAIGVYVLSKMFNKQVDKATRVNFRVTGDWEDPKLKVRRSQKK
jgi:uncharacterized protein (TIGR02099 family)